MTRASTRFLLPLNPVKTIVNIIRGFPALAKGVCDDIVDCVSGDTSGFYPVFRHCSIGFLEDEMAIDNDSRSDRLCWIIPRVCGKRDERLLVTTNIRTLYNEMSGE